MKISIEFIWILALVLFFITPSLGSDLNPVDEMVIRTLEKEYGKVVRIDQNAEYPKNFHETSIYKVKDGQITDLVLFLGIQKYNIDIGYIEKPSLDVSILSRLPKLKNLKIQEAKLGHVSSFKECPSLTHLELVSIESGDFVFLQDLHRLEYLSVEGAETLDVAVLKTLANLTVLKILNVDGLENYPGMFPYLEKLKELDLSLQKIGSIAPLSKLRGLKKLKLGKEETPLKLDLSNIIQIDDYSPLQSLGKLETLHLSDLNISSHDIELLKGLTKLKEFSIKSMLVTDLPFWIGDWNTKLNLYEAFLECPLKSPPLSVIKKGRNALKKFLSDEKAGKKEHFKRYRDLAILKEIEKKSNEKLYEKMSLKGWSQRYDSYLLDNQGRVIAIDISKIDNLTTLHALNELTHLRTLFIDEVHTDKIIFSEHELSKLDRLSQFEIRSRYSFSPLRIDFIKNLVNLKSLRLYYSGITDISSIATLGQIEELVLQGNKIQDISHLGKLRKLRTLNLYENPVMDISPIATLTGLRELDLSGVPIKNSDFLILKELIELNRLEIRSPFLDQLPSWVTEWNKNLNLYDVFRGCPLKSPPLYVMEKGRGAIKQFFYSQQSDSPEYRSKYRDLTIIESIEKQNGLKLLEIPVSSTHDAHPTQYFTNHNTYAVNNEGRVVVLNLLVNRIKNLNMINELQALNKLILSEDSFKERYEGMKDDFKERYSTFQPDQLILLTHFEGRGFDNISFLQYLKNLKYLKILDSRISDISALSNLPYLEELNLGLNNINNIIPLRELRNLKELHLHINKIIDLSPLANLINLESLSLFGNREIADISSLEKLTKLKYLALWNTSIRKLPEWIVDWNPVIKLEDVFSEGLIDPPFEIVKQGRMVIKTYFKAKKNQ